MLKSKLYTVLAWLILATLFVIADQWSKQLAESTLTMGNPIIVTNWFNWNLAYNPGAAWSFMADMGGAQRWILSSLSAVVSIALAIWIARLGNSDRWLSGALACVLGGAIGNLIDRVKTGEVVDFIQWHYAGYAFPTFNIADVAITIGACLLILHSIFVPEEKQDKS